MNIHLIAAMTSKRVIGKNNTIPWHIKEDLQNFKKLTQGNPVIMGRKTWDSIPEKFRPLPDRLNVIISSSAKERENNIARGIIWVSSYPQALYACLSSFRKPKDVYVIGGASIYQTALPTADTLNISWVKKDYEGDTFFPDVDLDAWEETEKKDFDEFLFIKYRRN